MSFCLDDGSELLYGPASADEPRTAILHQVPLPDEAATQLEVRVVEAEPRFGTGSESRKQELPRVRSARSLATLAGLTTLLLLGGSFFAYRYFGSAGGGPIRSIAVLPFENRSGSADADYLSDGLAESLIYRLSQLPDLKVSSTSSVMRYKGQPVDAGIVASNLGVQAVLTGRLVQRGENLNISVELVDAATNKTLWGEQYERQMSDLLTLQREIAAAVTQRLQVKLGGDRASQKQYTSSNKAYELYLKGRYAWNLRTSEGLQQAVEYYDESVAEDPGFALAYSGLAESYVLFPEYDVASASDSMPKGKAAALRALELDESLAEAHAALGAYLWQYEYNFKAAEAEFRRAIELDPEYATAHQWLGELLAKLKRFDEGLGAMRRALEADPQSPIIRTNIGWQYFYARKYDQAITEFNASLSAFPDFMMAQAGLCFTYNAKNDLARSIEECRKGRQLAPDTYSTGYLAMVLGRAGQTEEAEKLLNELKAEAQRRKVSPIVFAYAYIGLGRKEEAMQMMEREVDEHGTTAADIGVSPEFDGFRSEPRFKVLLRRMNLPE